MNTLIRSMLIAATLLPSQALLDKPMVFGQVHGAQNPEGAQRAELQEKLRQISSDKAGYASAIVSRWEDAGRTSGRWDESFSSNLYISLMRLQPVNLLAAGEATSFEAMMAVVATGHQPKPRTVAEPGQGGPIPGLGETNADLVYTAVTPCRIVDTRNAGGPIAAGTSAAFLVDASTFTSQGGFNGDCGIPFSASAAVAMTITVTQPEKAGYFTAWAIGGAQPFASVLNYLANQTLATTAIIPVAPGTGGNGFMLFSLADAHVVVDVVGYFAAPVATALACVTVSSGAVAAPINSWFPIDAACPAGTTATGGGYDTTEGTLGYPDVWLTSVPNANGWRTWVDNQAGAPRNILTYAVCCQIPGR
jgi:hypothetical protein